jgi:protein O-GlcNAc transferase
MRRVRISALRHQLPNNLIISLTSYPPRFASLAPVLKTLLSQSVKPDELILWIADNDAVLLPQDVLTLKEEGLTIKTCSDIKSYKKIIPTLELNRDSFIVTADDDILYERKWLEILISDYFSPHEVLFRRGHTITVDENMNPRPYREWNWQNTSIESSPLSFPTSGAGVLYPPKIFDVRVTDSDTFLTVAPTADDLWLFWMASLGGASFRRVGPKHYPLMLVWGTQTETLAEINNGTNDHNTAQLERLVKKFGTPWN